MPVPKPNAGETQDAFMGRCMHFMANDTTERPHDQQIAICLNVWKDAQGKEAKPEDYNETEPDMDDDDKSRAHVTIVTPEDRRRAQLTRKSRLTVPFEIKSMGTREFEGYGSVFGNVDLGGDVVVKGAFAKSLAAHRKSGSLPMMFWMHDPSRVPGKWIDMEEDDHGLYVHGLLAPTPLGEEMHALMKMEAVRGLSIGYMVTDDTYSKDGHRMLKGIDLWETSLVSLAMNPMAHVEHVKSQLSGAGEYVPTPREWEQYFREKGCSKRVSRVLVAKILAGDDSGVTLEKSLDRFFGKDSTGEKPEESRWDADDAELDRALEGLRDQVIVGSLRKFK